MQTKKKWEILKSKKVCIYIYICTIQIRKVHQQVPYVTSAKSKFSYYEPLKFHCEHISIKYMLQLSVCFSCFLHPPQIPSAKPIMK